MDNFIEKMVQLLSGHLKLNSVLNERRNWFDPASMNDDLHEQMGLT